MPPDHLLKMSLMIALYFVCSERKFCERLTVLTQTTGVTPSKWSPRRKQGLNCCTRGVDITHHHQLAI